MTVEELQIIIKANVEDALKGIKEVSTAVKQAVEQSVQPMQKIASQSKAIGSQTVMAMNNAKSSIRGLGKQIQTTTAQQELLLTKINDLKATLSFAEQDPKLFSKTEVLDMRVEVEKLERQLYKTQSTGKNTGNAISKGFDKGIKAAKRFIFNMFTVGSIFALVARASRSYLDTNEEARASNELTANVIGQLLAPAMEVLLNVVQYLIIGVALLVKMFTGFDALAKVTTKNLNKTTKATKSLNRELTSMDEITNLSNQDTSGLTSGFAADLSALTSFQQKVEQVAKLFEDWNIQGIVDKLKDLWNWLSENKVVLAGVAGALALAFGVSKVAGIVSGISKILGVGGAAAIGGTGLIGLASTLGWIAGIGIVAIEVGILVKGLSDLYKSTQELKNINNQLERVEQQLAILGKGGKFSITATIGSGGGSGGGRFATGGVVNQPTYGLMGEYPNANSNPEIIAPQSIMRETLQQALEPYMTMLASGGNSSKEIVLNINGRDLARATYNDFQNEGSRNGKQTTVRRVV